jgi:hypothetical protein
MVTTNDSGHTNCVLNVDILYYSNASHNDVSVNDGPHIRRWSHNILGVPRQAELALGVPGRLRPRIISTFGATRVVGRPPYAPAAFTPVEIPGTHFQRLSRPQGTWFCRKEPRKNIPSDTTGNRSRDRPASSALRYPRPKVP